LCLLLRGREEKGKRKEGDGKGEGRKRKVGEGRDRGREGKGRLASHTIFRPCSDMTCNVFGITLNPTQPSTQRKIFRP